ncbi:MAG: cytochrome c oxidase assembly protein, partial [Polyangiales bacterium]
MKGWQVVGSLWQLDSPAWWIAAIALIVYLSAFRPARSRRTAAFVGALAAFLLALVSPVAALADGYLFSAHVVQHLLLLLVAPPLLI